MTGATGVKNNGEYSQIRRRSTNKDRPQYLTLSSGELTRSNMEHCLINYHTFLKYVHRNNAIAVLTLYQSIEKLEIANIWDYIFMQWI